MKIFAFLIYLSTSLAFQCLMDNDCRSGFDTLDKYCVKNMCVSLKPAFAACRSPHECASFSFYGPLACSGKCNSQSECGGNFVEKTKYCCKPIPLKGKCNPKRPRSLSGCSRNHSCLTENGISRCVEKVENSWFMGTFLSISGNILINLGVNLQKKSYSSREVLILSKAVNTFILGSSIYGLGKLFSFSAYIFCSQSTLAGLSATGLISNCLLAPTINNEIFTWNDGITIILVIIGSTLVINNTSKSHTSYTVCELLNMLKKTENLLWLGFILFMIFVLYLTIKFVEVNSPRELVDDRFIFLKRENLFFEENDIVLKYLMIPIYVFLSSFIASFTTLSIKILGQIVSRYLNQESSVLSFTTVFFTSTLILCTLLQIYWLNRAVAYYDALIVVPIFHMSWTVLSILTAGIFFQDFDSFSKSQIRYFFLGILIIFGGSVFLGLKIKNKNRIQARVYKDNKKR